MNRQEAGLFSRLRVVPYSPVPPNKAMQTDGRFAAAADRQGVRPLKDCSMATGEWLQRRVNACTATSSTEFGGNKMRINVLRHRDRTSILAVAALLWLTGCGGQDVPGGGDGAQSALTPVGVPESEVDLRLRSAKPAPAPAPASEMAVRARAAFWDAFYAEAYEAISGLIRQLTAAVLENPRDPETVLLLAHTHLWKVAERTRIEMSDPTITDHLVLAEHYFEEAYRLHPEDHRILGWLGSVRVPLGAIRQDPAIAAEGARLLQTGIQRYPEFNLFTAAFTSAGLPADDARFREAIGQLWRNIDSCSGIRSDDAPTETYEIAQRVDPSCANTTKAPHNFEGFVLNLGDMLVKAGEPSQAVSVYARARLAPAYPDWPYRELLEERIENVESAAQGVREGRPPPMMFGSAYTCAACHARR